MALERENSAQTANGDAPACNGGHPPAAAAAAAVAADAAGNGRGAPPGETSERQHQADYRAQADLPDMAGYGLWQTFPGHTGAVTAVRFNREGQVLASSSSDTTARLWHVDSGQLQHTLAGHTCGISDVAWSKDGRMLATASDDSTLRLWDAATGRCLRTLHGHTHYVFCCAFNQAGNMLVSGGYDETVLLWDLHTGRCIKEIPAHSDPVTGVDFTSEAINPLVASCSFDGLARVWEASSGKCRATLTDEENPPVAYARFSPNNRYLLTAAMNSRLLLWDYSGEQRRVKKTYTGHLHQKHSLQATLLYNDPNPQRQYVVSGSEDHHVYLWDLQSTALAGILRGRPNAAAPGEGHCAAVLGVDACVQPGRPLIASAGGEGDRTVKLWRLTASAS